MSVKEINDKLIELAPKSAEPELTEEQLAGIPDDLPFQDDEQFDMANENARLDDIYPEYKGETINIDGKERTVYNSNGERIAKSEQALRNFYKWFGDSKVVDEQGRPLVVYHGTSYKFDTFDIGKAGSHGYRFGKGFYFTANEKSARSYGENLLPVYLKIEKPYFISDDSSPDSLRYFANKGLADKGLLTDNEWQEMLTKNYPEHALGTAESLAIKGVDFSEYPKSKGYDGVIVGNFNEVIVFNGGEYEQTRNTIEQVLSMNPVFELTGQEFQKDKTPLTVKVNNYYKENYNNQVERDGVGVIKLDMRGIKDSIAHGVGKEKASAFMAVPEVIKNGLIFDEQTKWKDRNYDSVSFIAPITMNGERYTCEVIVKKTKDRTGFYLHNVELEKKLADVLKTRPDTEFSTGTPANSKLSIAKKWQEVKSSNRIKSVNNRGTYSSDTGNIYLQSDFNSNESLKSLKSLEKDLIMSGKLTDLSKDFKKNPTIDDVKEYIKHVFNNGSVYATLSPDWLIDLQGNTEHKKHIIYSERYKDMQKQEKNRHNKYAMAFKKIINKALYDHSTPNTKNETKPNIAKYHYFISYVKINDMIYTIILDTEERVGENTKKPQTVHLYNIKEVLATRANEFNDTSTSNGSIINFLSDDVKNRLKDFQQDKKVKEKNNNLQLQNNQVGKGGAYDPTTRSITLGGKADATTLPHELAHYWIDKNFKWARSGKASQEWKRQWQAVEKWLGIDPEDKVLSKQASEKFARAYEKFLGEEKAPLVLEKKETL